MRRDVVLALFLASTSGLFAAVGAYNWMPSGVKEIKVQTAAPAIDLTTVVVAKAELAFGTQVAIENIIEAKWPAANVPEGSYKTIQDFFAEQANRVVLETIRANEPLLKGKVTGPGQRATLSSMLGSGMKAVTIHVNDVRGVGGFVMPGDYVDVLLTVEPKDDEARKKPSSTYSELLLERMRVLAIDQVADLKQSTPKLAQTVTVEASIQNAQRLALASTVGTLSLVLRSNANVENETEQRRVTLSDLNGDIGDKAGTRALQPTNAVAPEPQPVPPVDSRGGDGMATVSVVRSVQSSEYSVMRTKSR